MLHYIIMRNLTLQFLLFIILHIEEIAVCVLNSQRTAHLSKQHLLMMQLDS